MALTKCMILMAVALAAYCVAAKPIEPEVDFDAFSKKIQEDAQKQFEDFKKQTLTGFPELPPLDVKSLPKDGNTHVYGEKHSSYHVKTNVDGVVKEESGGHKVINDDGKITEYDTA